MHAVWHPYITAHLSLAQMMHLGVDLQGRRHKLSIPSEFASVALDAVKTARTVCSTIAPIKPDVCVVNWC